MKKALLFDFGGTLDTDGIHWSEKFWEAYSHFQIPISKEIFREAFIYSEKKCAGIIKTDFNLRQTFETQLKYQMEYLQNKFYLSSVYSLIISELKEYCHKSVIKNVSTSQIIIESLEQSYLLGLISNYYGNVEAVLKELSLKIYFASIIDSTVIGIRKPDTQIFEVALNELDINPTDAIVIGDSYSNDIAPAKLLGCDTIWINNKGWNNPDEIGSADKIIKSIKELPPIIKEFN
jgi:putative hydrolase of the HAD superfamily